MKKSSMKKSYGSLCDALIGRRYPKVGPSLIVLCHPFRHLYLAERLDYWTRDRDSELHFGRHARGIFAGSFYIVVYD